MVPQKHPNQNQVVLCCENVWSSPRLLKDTGEHCTFRTWSLSMTDNHSICIIATCIALILDGPVHNIAEANFAYGPWCLGYTSFFKTCRGKHDSLPHLGVSTVHPTLHSDSTMLSVKSSKSICFLGLSFLLLHSALYSSQQFVTARFTKWKSTPLPWLNVRPVQQKEEVGFVDSPHTAIVISDDGWPGNVNVAFLSFAPLTHGVFIFYCNIVWCKRDSSVVHPSRQSNFTILGNETVYTPSSLCFKFFFLSSEDTSVFCYLLWFQQHTLLYWARLEAQGLTWNNCRST